MFSQASKRLDPDQKFSKEMLMKADAKAVQALQQQRASARVSRLNVEIRIRVYTSLLLVVACRDGGAVCFVGGSSLEQLYISPGP